MPPRAGGRSPQNDRLRALQDAPRARPPPQRSCSRRVVAWRARRASATTYYLSSMATHLDGLAALGERERVETEAGRLLQPNTYLEPFALRALASCARTRA